MRVRLLGENLVAYRAPDGRIGLVEENCPHRGASLAYARNEPGGLRCLYHGWKINADGAVVETPAEPAESTFAKRICHPAYETREAGGIVWTYMGPREKKPVFPRFPWFNLKPPHLLVAKIYQDCNYLQGLEGDIDPAHPNYLHKDLTDRRQRELARRRLEFDPQPHVRRRPRDPLRGDPLLDAGCCGAQDA